MSDISPVIEVLGAHGLPARSTEQIGSSIVHYVDLSALHLSLSDATPFILLGQESGIDSWIPDGSSPASRLESVLARLPLRGSLGYILLDSDAPDHERERIKQLISLPLVILDRQDQVAFASSDNPSEALVRLSLKSVPVSDLLPYRLAGPVTGSRFFGRESELRMLSRSHGSFAIIAPRRMGKTSLLSELRRRLTIHGDSTSIVHCDCGLITSGDDFAQLVIERITSSGAATRTGRDWARRLVDVMRLVSHDGSTPITLLVDEAERLIADRDEGTRLLTALLTATNEGYCRVLMCGFRGLLSEMTNINSPAYNFLGLIVLKPFTYLETESVVIEPLTRVGIDIVDSAQVISRIFIESGGFPNLIQYYCLFLAENALKKRVPEITLGDLETVYENPVFRNRVIEPLLAHTTPIEQACLFGASLNPALDEGFSVAHLLAELEANGIAVSIARVREALRSLETWSVVSPIGSKTRHRFSAGIFPVLLRREQDLRDSLRRIAPELKEPE